MDVSHDQAVKTHVFLCGKTHVSYIFHIKKHSVLLPAHDHSQIPFLGSDGYFHLSDPQKCIFSCSIYNFRSMGVSHDHTDFGAQIPVLGSEGLFSFFFTPERIHFLHLYKISDRLLGHMTIILSPPV
jgi:hypothetical protein